MSLASTICVNASAISRAAGGGTSDIFG